VGALYASGKTGVQLQQAALQIEEVALADWMVPIVNRGLFRGEALARYVNEAVGSRLLEDMRIPFGVVATDLGNGQAVLFRRGDTGSAVRASSAVPGVFQPVRISGRDYVAPDDVQAVLPQTIAHRLIPVGDAGRGAEEQVRAMLQAVPLP
jgi:NTE family protein